LLRKQTTIALSDFVIFTLLEEGCSIHPVSHAWMDAVAIYCC